jgi:hypothetical protein
LPGAGPCEGRMDRCHLIAKSRLKREFGGKDVIYVNLRYLLWHPDVWVWGCRRHHQAFDARQLKVQRLHLPPSVERFAEAFGLGWSLDADYGVRESAAK